VSYFSSSVASSRLGERVFLWTDASLVGFGAVLEQYISDGEQVPIAYAMQSCCNSSGTEVQYN